MNTPLARTRPNSLGPVGPPRHIIAIDPDVDKSGVAFLHLPSRELRCEARSFPELIDALHATKQATDALCRCRGRMAQPLQLARTGRRQSP